MDLETHYEGAHISFNASVVRHGLWNAFLSGSAGFTYGHQAVWQMYAPEPQLAHPWLYMSPRLDQAANESWRDGLWYPGSAQAGYVQKLFAGLDRETFDRMQPNRAFIKTPEGSPEDILDFEANRYVAGLAGSSHYWVYTGFGDSFDLDLDALGACLGTANGTAIPQWYDPRTGNFQNGTNYIVLQGRQTFLPTDGGSVDDDWIRQVEL